MKHAFITGASSGLGLALARELSLRGYRVALAARRTDLLEEESARLGKLGRPSMALTCDVADEASVANAVHIAEKTWGPIDLAIANAGIGNPTPALGFDIATAKSIMEINFTGLLHLFHATVPGMLARRQGQFAGVASLAGLRGMPSSAAYSASKAAMQSFLEAMRIELSLHGVTVSTINPGFVKTPMTDKNRYDMPFMWPVERAARFMADGLESKRREIEFPWQLTAVTRLARLLPNAVYDRIMARVAGQALEASKVAR